ncbi:MAG: chloride channel protein [Phycisphaerae bacterium]|nr:chloride channel protein [Phycisphaerae bacterium]
MPTARLKTLVLNRENRAMGRLLVLCILVGLVAGAGAVAFFYMLEAGKFFCMDYLAGYQPATAGYEKPLFSMGSGQDEFRRWLLLILPAAGGLISGVLVFWLAPEAEGHGTDAAIEAYHFKGGMVRTRVPIIKAIASMITIGSGGSAGREGPIAQIGSGFGSIMARVLKLSRDERRILMATGMGAGIGAIFHAPLAGALFAGEVMYRKLDIEHEVLVPVFIASIVAYAVFGSVFGFHPLFLTPPYEFNDPVLLVPFCVLALVCAGGAALYVTAFYTARKYILHGLRVPNHIKPAIGGLFVGVIGFFLPEALGTGYGVVQLCFDGHVDKLLSAERFTSLLPDGLAPGTVAMLLLATIGLAKIVTTSLSIGSGGSGGVFGPAIVIGGALGGATGCFCQILFPGMGLQPGAFALVGMAGFFAAAANTPISTIIMVSEMTGNYNLLVPSMLVCILAYVLCRRFTLYDKQLPSHFDAPSQMGNMATAVLRRLTVAEALVGKKDSETIVVSRDTGFRELMACFAETTQDCLPVVDEKQQLTGVIDTRDIRQVIGESGLEDVVIAGDIEGPARTLTPRDSLLTAIQRMVSTRSDELVVVDECEPRKVVGTLSRSDAVATYDRQLLAGLGH